MTSNSNYLRKVKSGLEAVNVFLAGDYVGEVRRLCSHGVCLVTNLRDSQALMPLFRKLLWKICCAAVSAIVAERANHAQVLRQNAAAVMYTNQYQAPYAPNTTPWLFIRWR